MKEPSAVHSHRAPYQTTVVAKKSMNRPDDLISIKRETLERLLKKAGEDWDDSVSENHGPPALSVRLQRRVRAAKWSCVWLAFTAALSLGSWFWSHSIENTLSTLAFTVMTCIEIRVYTLFKQGDKRAPVWGFRNQCAFASSFLIYGLYHYMNIEPMETLVSLCGSEFGSVVIQWEKIFYLCVGIGGAVGQMILGWHYWRLKNKLFS